MMLMLEKVISRGITQAVECYVKANDKYLKEQYNRDTTSAHLQYLHRNKLYNWVMIQKLPLNRFKWEKADNFNSEK